MLDLVEVAKVEMVEPSGWINVDLDSGKDDSVRAFMLQVNLKFGRTIGTHMLEKKLKSFSVFQNIPMKDFDINALNRSLLSSRSDFLSNSMIIAVP